MSGFKGKRIELNKEEIRYFKNQLDGQYINVHRLVEEPNHSRTTTSFTNLDLLIPELRSLNADYNQIDE